MFEQWSEHEHCCLHKSQKTETDKEDNEITAISEDDKAAYSEFVFAQNKEPI